MPSGSATAPSRRPLLGLPTEVLVDAFAGAVAGALASSGMAAPSAGATSRVSASGSARPLGEGGGNTGDESRCGAPLPEAQALIKQSMTRNFMAAAHGTHLRSRAE